MLTYNVLNSWVEKLMKKDLPVKIKTSDITSLSTKDINKLKAGDIVLKKTGNQKHTYIVGYKENNQGICLTYTDATVIETVSYDYNTTTKEWVYNSTDIGRVGGVEYTAGDGISITNGVIANTAKGKQLYQHNIVLTMTGLEITLEFISSKATYTKEEFYQYIIDNYDATGKLLSCKGIYKNPNATSGYIEIIGLYKSSAVTQDYIGLSCYDFNFNFDDKIVSATQTNLTNFRYTNMNFNDDVITL